MSESEFLLNIEDISLSNNPLNYETIFSLSNGYLGTRGSKEEDFINNNGADQGTFVNGFYESEPINYGEAAYGYAKNSQTIARVPNAKQLIFSYNGSSFSEGIISDETYFLNMKSGILHRSFIWTSKNGEKVEVKIERFVSMIQKNYLFINYQVVPLTNEGIFNFEGQFTTQDRKILADEDPRKAKSLDHFINSEVRWDNQKYPYIETITSTSKLKMVSSLLLSDKEELINPNIEEKISGYSYDFEKKVSKNKSYSFVQQVYYGKNIEQNHLNYKKEKNNHEKYWQDFWEISDIKIKGDEKLQKGIRHNLFHLNQAAGRDGQTNISAKGITGDGYEGHYFWDTEMYMLPFFIYTQPEIAKQLLLYRYSIMDKATLRARELGIESGVLFPWRTINGEECSAYYPAGTAQVHINGDIAYAIQTYVDVTNDQTFMLEYGSEMLIEIARFWISFGDFKNGEFLINGVTGPDEYTALINNNFYTNKLAKYNLECAIKVVKNLIVRSKFNVDEEEILEWTKAAKLMRLPYDKNKKLTLQDDGMNLRAVWPFETTSKDKYPLLLNFHPMIIYKYQVNKQADTILAQYLFEHDFEKTQLIRDFTYYEKITTHDSSLSRSIFGIMATHLNQIEIGYNYFMDTVSMDLEDIQGNTIDGIHAANLGGMWLGLIKGFGGISVIDGQLFIKPKLPKKWQELRFNLKYQDSLLEIIVAKDKVKVILKSGKKITIDIYGESYILENELVISD